jgi:hypothetical protein
MRKHMLVAGAAVLALGFNASMVSAQCTFPHPKSAKQLKSSLVQAFVSCGNLGGNDPDDSTEGGFPSCTPPESFNEQAGSPSGGWLWGPSGKGDVSFKAGKNKVVHPNNPPNDSADLAVQLKLSGLLDENGVVDGSNGTLFLLARSTLRDRVNGPMTMIDFPFGFPITAINGKINKKTSLNVSLNGIGQPGLPKCTSIEVVDVKVIDPNGNQFAAMGTFFPE